MEDAEFLGFYRNWPEVIQPSAIAAGQRHELALTRDGKLYIRDHYGNRVSGGCSVVFCKRDRSKCPCYELHRAGVG